LLYVTLAAAAVRLGVQEADAAALAPSVAPFLVGFQVVAMALFAGLYFLIGRRKRWALAIFLFIAGLYAIGLSFSVRPMVDAFLNRPVMGSLGLLEYVGQLAAVVLLIRAESRAWFRTPNPAPPAG
jgi:hypothetical protein